MEWGVGCMHAYGEEINTSINALLGLKLKRKFSEKQIKMLIYSMQIKKYERKELYRK